MTATERQRLACLMDFLVAHHGLVDYAEVRPILHATSPAELEQLVLRGKFRTDCSGSTTTLFEAVGASNPNGVAYSTGRGDTQMMYDHLPHYLNPKGAGIGALCFFGVPGELATQHVTIVRHPGKDPVLFTHGHQGDPSYRLLSWMRSGFQGHPVFLNVSRL